MKTQLPFLTLCAAALLATPPLLAAEPERGKIEFGRDVRPILAKHCITCHGPDPDARQADLRLDTQAGSRSDLGGYQAVVPKHPDKSELISRITSVDEDTRMPPADQHPPLSNNDIETLTRWIASGGAYQMHWAFVAPQTVNVPSATTPDGWSRNPIDRFVLQRMRENRLKPSAETSRESLIRRVYMDLAGIVPTPNEVSKFVDDERPSAYRRLVDRLLATPEYAERFARPWLDLARYSDTNGYEKDRPRTIWPYRDWVIEALSADMPFDQFTIEQLAGDMLPNATREQKIATGFHRNTMMNEEGGIDPLEYRFYAMVDRVATTGTVWMGLTTGCAQCHTHKYDPITHTDYYSMLALMNNADEPEIDADPGELTQKRNVILRRIQTTTDKIASDVLDSNDDQYAAVRTEFDRWWCEQFDQASDWTVLRPVTMEATTPRLQITASGSILASGDVTKREVYTLQMPPWNRKDPITAIRLEALPHDSLPADGPGMAYYEGRRGDFFLSELMVVTNDQKIPFKDGSSSYGKISVGSGSATAANVIDTDGSTGWSTSNREGEANRLVLNFAKPFAPQGAWELKLLFERHFVAALGHLRISATTRNGGATAAPHGNKLEAALYAARDGKHRLSSTALQSLRRHFVQTSEILKNERKVLDNLRREMPTPVRTLAMRERGAADQRETHRHHRGEYLQPKETVSPAVPALFLPIDGEPNRLSLAQWLVSSKNPLVGRVTVNRAWREFFGTGIVRTAGDFGTQSEPPSHPKLIDWLERDWRTSGWSMKRLHRELVMSSTYQQAVGPAPPQDLQNRLLSVFPHRRFDAERIRDAFLSAAGLLTRKVGGPSVYPPQPDSVTKMAYGNTAWTTSRGGDRFRRSLYTFSKRTAPFAAFTTFDGPSGEQCVARRDSSTTPLQALTLMNDAMYLEIARGLADRAIRDVGESARKEEIANRIFKRVLTRSPESDEVAAIVAFHDSQSGHAEPWTLVARALMNTDEAITTP